MSTGTKAPTFGAMLRGRRFGVTLIAIPLLAAIWFITYFPWTQLTGAAISLSSHAGLSNPYASSDTAPIGQKVAVIVENRPLSNLVPLILHFSNVLGPSWPIVLYTGGNLELQTLLGNSIPFQRAIRDGRVQPRSLPSDVKLDDHEEISAFFTQPRFWEELAPAKHVLMFQSDSILCSNSEQSVEDYLEYDFIGAPIAPGNGQGFNGGLSLRNRELMLDISTTYSWKGERNTQRFSSLEQCVEDWPCLKWEDQWFVHKMKEVGHRGKLAQKAVAAKFSVETVWADRPLGYHQVERWNKDRMEEVEAWCPEYKMATNDLMVNHHLPGA
jgi:hypothetical protein